MTRQAQDDPKRSGWQAAFTPSNKRHPEPVEGCALPMQEENPKAIIHNKTPLFLFHKNANIMRLYRAMHRWFLLLRINK